MKKSGDYTIFKIRYYADGINVRKGIFSNSGEQIIKQHERAKEYNRFYWQMVEKVTGHSLDYWTLKYFMSSNECATEELFAEHDILIPESEEYYYWFIPNHMASLIEWINENCMLPIKIIKRAPYSTCLNNKKTTWRRTQAEEFTRCTLKK